MQKKAVFRHGSTANFDTSFTQGQIWVNSKPKTWRPPKQALSSLDRQINSDTAAFSHEELADNTSPTASVSVEHFQESPSAPIRVAPREASAESNEVQVDEYHNIHSENRQSGYSHQHHSSLTLSSPASWSRSPQNAGLPPSGSDRQYTDPGTYTSLQYWETETDVDYSLSPSSTTDLATTSSESVQESCLMRYFIEELSPWV